MNIKELLLAKSKKGVVVGGAVAVVSAAIAIFIGIWIVSLVLTSVNQSGWTAQANTTFTSVQNTTWSAFTLLAVGLIALAASIIFLYFGGMKR